MYDLAIIGAGPAGAALAQLLAHHARILLVEKREPADSGTSLFSGKCCGGLLAPAAQCMLARLGLGLPGHILAEPQLFGVRAVDLKAGHERLYQRHYINVHRTRLQAWLQAMVPNDVDCRYATALKGLKHNGDHAELDLVSGRKHSHESARYVIGADGAASAVRRLAFPKAPVLPRYIAIQQWYDKAPALPHFSAFFNRDITDFYAWTIPKQNHLIFGAALKPGRQAHQAFDALRTQVENTVGPLPEAAHTHGAFIARPTRPAHVFVGAGRTALLGEAAGLISPSSAEGISYALASAAAFAHAWRRDPGDAVPGYRTLTRPLRLSVVAKILKSALVFNPVARRLLMATGLLALRRIDRWE